MKLKYYLRGLGIGIICTAIIMGIALSGNKKETMTDTEIIERARLLGMVMPDEAEEPSEAEDGQEQPEDKKSRPEEPENGKSQDLTKDKISGSKADNETSDGNKTDVQNAEDNKADENKAEDSSDKNQGVNMPGSSQGTVQFEIKSGEYSDTISRKLFQAGLISDAEAFNKYLTKKGADQNLRVGVYEIPVGATQDEIIDIFQK